jgi:exodeoxyribonuclease VII large subunit
VVWVTAEIAQMGTTRGHRYLDLVEHDASGVVAQLSATLWQGEYRKLKLHHGDTLDQLLKAGTQVKLGVVVQFHERFGLKANIQEIDVEWTFGHLELLKRKTLDTLRSMQLMDANKQRPLRMVLQRIAVISSEKAAGLQDFVQQLRANTYGYAYRLSLFDTLVQGANAEAEIIKALREVAADAHLYDVVVVIRGGGARLDLAVFDQLDLNMAAAQMPIPVLVGIGHDTDQTVLDLVAHTALKTPTAVAEYLVQHNMQYEVRLRQILQSISALGVSLCRQSTMQLERAALQMRHTAQARLQSSAHRLEAVEKNIPKAIKQTYLMHLARLDAMALQLATMHPNATLQRGFTITRYKGQAITAANDVLVGAEVETETAKGRFVSRR